MKEAILKAAKATDIPAGSAGLWAIKKYEFKEPTIIRNGNTFAELEAGSFTQLLRWTQETIDDRLNGNESQTGEVVMEDSRRELNKHLQFMLKAKGRVLVTGLGLGCVVRGLLANPNVTKVVVVERDLDIIKMVQAHMPKTERLYYVIQDARDYLQSEHCWSFNFDCAWHDVWDDKDKGEPELAIIHTDLIRLSKGKVQFQGAWDYPRMFRRRLKEIANVI